MGLLRRLVDGFLRFVTPPQREHRWIVLNDAGDWAADGADERTIAFHGLLGGGAFDIDDARRLGYWPGQEHRQDFIRAWHNRSAASEDALERPWNFRWDRLPKRSAGPGFGREDYRNARERAIEVARRTLGEAEWARLEDKGFLDVASRLHPGITYRLRVGRRIEVLRAPGVRSPWYYDFLCINPAYPLPEHEFFAQLYLYVRDQEDEILRVAAPQPWDQALGRTF
jgi:hypothetical protein